MPIHPATDRSPRNSQLAGATTDLAILVCYAATLFTSALLLFAVQPLVARLILPRLGGSPAVWNTSLVFFQTLLLLGYAFAFAVTRWLPMRGQTVLQALVVAGAIVALPLALPSWAPPVDANPTGWLLATLAIGVGGPFFALSTTAPLLQRWFAATRHSRANDPYFLYAWSNAGSLLALVSYPLVIEPILGLTQTARYWSVGYFVFVAMTIVAAVTLWRWPADRIPLPLGEGGRRPGEGALPQPVAPSATRIKTKTPHRGPLPKGEGVVSGQTGVFRERLWWLALSAVPTSWMLAVTMHLTTDLAPVPLLWILPLALYLITFIIAFGSWGLKIFPVAVRLFAPSMILLAASLIFSGRWQLWLIDLGAFFIGALVCHAELARRRPDVARLPEFYFWVSLGGALGGAFNALVAPVIFPAVYEYPLTVGLACLLAPAPKKTASPWPNLVTLAITMALVGLLRLGADVAASPLAAGVVVGLGVLGLLLWRGYTRWFAPVMAVLLLCQQTSLRLFGEQRFVGRSFFGVLHVQVDEVREIEDKSGRKVEAPRYVRLLHGSTLHGLQSPDPNRLCEPLGYYARGGPLGEIMTLVPPVAGSVDQVAVIGLGTGAAACYAGPQRKITFYEIDPLVLEVAETHFSYLSRCGDGHVSVVLGDGRLQLAKAPDGEYRLIILDAFSSDAIPMHLLTREALAVYLAKLAPGGLIGYHVTNNYLDLVPVLAALADEAGLVGLVRRDMVTDVDIEAGKFNATYVVLARRHEDFASLAKSGSWRPLDRGSSVRVWTDDYANLIGALKWDPTAAFVGP